MIHAPSDRRTVSAFTLVELLVVIVVLAMLLLVAVPSMFSSTSASQLTATGDLLLNKLSETQQEAIASDSEVEVCFIMSANARALEPVPRLRSFQVLRMTSLHEGGPETDLAAAEEVIRFADGIVVSSKPKITSIFEAGTAAGTNPGVKSDATTPAAKSLGVRFNPDGSTNLPPGSPWFITLVSEESEANEGVPANFYTIQIDPATGRIRSFRP